MYDNFIISRDLAAQFAYDCYDIIIRDIKAMEEKELEESEVKQNGADKSNECA